MTPTDVELSTALMALRALVYQAEYHLSFLTTVSSPEDRLDQDDLEYTQDCLDAINPAISWLEERMQIRLQSPSNF